MEWDALFKVRSEAKERVLAAFAVIDICKNEVSGYAYNDANTLVTEIMKVLTRVDEARDLRKATAPREKTESAHATTDSEDRGQSRGRSKGHRRIDKKTTCKMSPSPSTLRSPTPPPSKGRSRSKRQSKISNGKKIRRWNSRAGF